MSQPPNQLTPAPEEQNEDKQFPASFVGKSGRFYIRQHRTDGIGYHHRLTVWPSVDDYNHRKPVPVSFCDATDVLADFSHALHIYPESLTTTPPVYKRERDETDLGLTARIDYPQRDAWKDRFTKTRQRHAA